MLMPISSVAGGSIDFGSRTRHRVAPQKKHIRQQMVTPFVPSDSALLDITT
jgi:hypothetical protein